MEGISFTDLIEKIKGKWPDASMDDIDISTEYIHTDCLGYDQYNPCDYTNYIVLEKKQNF